MLNLNDNKWSELNGGCGHVYDPSVALEKLGQASSKSEINDTLDELWEGLYHKGHFGATSLYTLPHLVRIAKERQLLDINLLALITSIEIERHNSNTPLPKELRSSYMEALGQLLELAKAAINENWDLKFASSTLTSIALAKGQHKLANAILSMDNEHVVDDFLDNY